MNEIKINGEIKKIEIKSEDRFDSVMKLIRSQFIQGTELVSSLKLDGMELTPENEDEIAALPVGNIKSLEIVTATPVAMAEDTLHTLEKFILSVVQMCQDISREENQEKFENGFSKLIDGIQIIADTITAVKLTLKPGYNQTVAILEADLLDLLKDLVHAKESNLDDYLRDLLREHLPRNLTEWSMDGLHALVSTKAPKENFKQNNKNDDSVSFKATAVTIDDQAEAKLAQSESLDASIDEIESNLNSEEDPFKI